MSELFFLGRQVSARRIRRGDFERQPLGDRQAVPFDPHQLARVVAEQTHRADAQLAQDLDTHSVIALIRFEAEPLVGLDRVEALVLELVRANLVREPDAAAFLIQIQQDAAAFLGDPLHGRIELGAAVTADRVQSVAGQARRVDADEDVRAVLDIAANERDVRLVIDLILERVDAEIAILGRHLRRGDALDERLRAHPVGDQIGDRDHQQAVPPGEPRQLRHPRHRPIFVHHLADDPGRVQSRDPRDVDRRLGLPRARQHAAGPRAQRKHVPGSEQIGGPRRRIDGGEHGGRAVRGGNAGARPILRFNRNAERRIEPRAVLRHHQRNLELVEALRRHREANQPAPVPGHEIHRFRRDLLGGDRQIALILPIRVVHDDDHLAGPDGLDRLVDARKRRFRFLCDLEFLHIVLCLLPGALSHQPLAISP